MCSLPLSNEVGESLVAAGTERPCIADGALTPAAEIAAGPLLVAAAPPACAAEEEDEESPVHAFVCNPASNFPSSCPCSDAFRKLV